MDTEGFYASNVSEGKQLPHITSMNLQFSIFFVIACVCHFALDIDQLFTRTAYDAKIFAVSTLLSSYLIYNSVKVIDQSAIEYVEYPYIYTRVAVCDVALTR
jgi:hypothetical protein